MFTQGSTGYPISYFDDHEFRDRFRFHKASVVSPTEMLKGDLAIEGNRRGNPIAPILEVLIAFRFYADGSVHRTGADLFNVSDASVCRIIHRMCT